MFDSPAAALRFLKDREIALVDLKVVSIAGRWLHITLPARHFSEKYFAEGVGYDGSSGAGFARVESGDVAALPDPATAFIDPFSEHPTLSFLCSTVAADTHEPLAADPRSIAGRAVAHLRSTGLADEAWMGPEYEFHLFERVEVDNEPLDTGIRITAPEVHTRGALPSIPHKQGYMRTPPGDQFHDIRSEIMLTLEGLGVPVRYHHHEVGAPGQCEIETELAPLVTAADRAMLIKYVVKNIARRHGLLATFMPKPVYGEAGNGMHVHQKLEHHGRPIFYDDRQQNYANLSDVALNYTGGLLRRGAALAGLTNPSTNSYKRLVEGYEAPVNLFFSLGNRSAAVRVPRYATQPHDKRIEYRPPDFTGNAYITLAAMLLAGIEGIQTPPTPSDGDFGPYDVDMEKQPTEVRSRIAALPRTLYDALDALAADHAFLRAGDVFPQAFIDTWIERKRAEETQEINVRPHPYEFALYLDV